MWASPSTATSTTEPRPICVRCACTVADPVAAGREAREVVDARGVGDLVDALVDTGRRHRPQRRRRRAAPASRARCSCRPIASIARSSRTGSISAPTSRSATELATWTHAASRDGTTRPLGPPWCQRDRLGDVRGQAPALGQQGAGHGVVDAEPLALELDARRAGGVLLGDLVDDVLAEGERQDELAHVVQEPAEVRALAVRAAGVGRCGGGDGDRDRVDVHLRRGPRRRCRGRARGSGTWRPRGSGGAACAGRRA